MKLTLRRALGLFFLLAIPLGLGLILCSDAVSVYLIGDARTRLGIVLLVPCVLLTGVENLHKHCFYGMGQVGPPAFTETMEQLIRTGAVLGLLLLLRPRTGEGRVGAIVAGMVLCEIFSALALTLIFRRRMGRVRVTGTGASMSRLGQIALPVALTSLLGTLLGSANAVLIPKRLVAGGMGTGEAMAAFGVMCGMTLPLLSMPTGIVNALCLTMVPDLARRTAGGDRRAAGRFLDRVLAATSLLMAPAMALLAVIGPAVGRAMYREQGVGEYIVLLAVGTLLGCYQSVLSGALNGLGLQRKGARNAILSDAVQLAFTFFAVKSWGLAGFAAGFVLSSLVGAGMNLASVLRETGLPLRAYRWFVRPMLASILMGLWCQLCFRYLQGAGMKAVPACALCTLFGGILYVSALLAQGISVTDPLRYFTRRSVKS